MSLQDARKLIDSPNAASQGFWPRAAAVLVRQSLEEQVLKHLGPDYASCSMRAKLLLLEDKLGPQRAGELAYLYGALSQACHYHPYQSPPTAEELRDWIARLS